MSKAVDELQEQIDALEAKKLAQLSFESKLGTVNAHVDEFHKVVCLFDHTASCGYQYEGIDYFDRAGSTKNRFKVSYLKKKRAIEEIFGVTVSHEEFMAAVEALRASNF